MTCGGGRTAAGLVGGKEGHMYAVLFCDERASRFRC